MYYYMSLTANCSHYTLMCILLVSVQKAACATMKESFHGHVSWSCWFNSPYLIVFVNKIWTQYHLNGGCVSKRMLIYTSSRHLRYQSNRMWWKNQSGGHNQGRQSQGHKVKLKQEGG